MTANSSALSVTPVGRAVAQSVLHPRSADQLIEYAARRVDEFLPLAETDVDEATIYYALLHAVYSSDEYSVHGGKRFLPFQLDGLIQNTLADAIEDYLIERPWRRNPPAANAALLALRWIGGQPTNKLSPEFPYMGSGVLQAMFRDGADMLYAWSDCIMAATGLHLVDDDRTTVLRGNRDLLRALRKLSSAMRTQAQLLRVGLPGDVAWIAGLASDGAIDTGRPILTRPAILALRAQGLSEPLALLRRDSFKQIVETLKPLALPRLDDLVRDFRNAVRAYRQNQRRNLWQTTIDRAPDRIAKLLRGMRDARGTDFEKAVEGLLDAIGVPYMRLDDGQTAGAADLHVGLNHKVQVVVELKTAQGEGMVGLNNAIDVIGGAAIVDLTHLPKATVANPGFDPNVPWQARNAKELALVEAHEFGYGISLVARGEIDKDTFLDWLAQPGVNSIPVYRSS